MAIGANYWASHAATEMWRKWDAAAVDRDLKVLSENGIRILRVFPNWADFQPIHACCLACGSCNNVYETRMFDSEAPLPDTPCGRAGVDEKMVEHFEEFCDIAEKYGLKLIVPLLTGQMTFRVYVPPALVNRNPFSDSYSLMWEGRYLECMVTRLKAKKAIVAWESGNESRILGNSEDRFRSEAWLRFVHQTIRCADPSRPVIGVDGLCIDEHSQWPTSVNAALSDYTTTHPYGFWGSVYNDDVRSVRSVTFAASQTLALEQIGGKPAFIEEHGLRRQEQASQTHAADYARAMLWNAWAADNRAMLWWCAYDQTKMMIAPYDWRQPCVELGAFRRDRKPYPIVDVFGKFAKMQDKLPFAALPKAKTHAVVLTTDPEVVQSTYILARQAGIMPRFANPEHPLPEAKVYFLPNALGRAFLTLHRWEELKAKVREGATLYLSWNDTFLDEMEAVGGIEIAKREKVGGIDECDFGDFKMSFGYGVRRKFNALTAKVLAKNQNGDGVFFCNQYGKGKVYVFAHNFEKTYAGASGKFEGNAYKIWEKVCPHWRLMKTDEKNVFISEHCFGGGRCGVLVVNNRSVAYEGVPTMQPNWSVDSVITDDPTRASWKNGRLTLAPDSGILLMTSKKKQCAADPNVRYLDEFDLKTMTCGMGKRPQPRKTILGKPLRLGKSNTVYARGVGTHSESVMLFDANGKVTAFDAVVGVDRETQEYPADWRTRRNYGSCSFRVFADGRCVADSGVIKENDEPKKLHAELKGAKKIMIECTDGGFWAGYLCGHGDWADARFTCEKGATIKPAPVDDPLLAQWGILTPPERPEPQINGASVWGVRPGHAILYRVPVSGVRPLRLTAKGLPKGATFDAAKGILGGSVAEPGKYEVKIVAENARGRAERTLTIAVGEKISLTPPMGWNSWNIYGGSVTDAKIREQARGMDASGLANHGWAYVNIDDWWMKNKGAGCKGRPEHDGPARDAAGRMIPQALFPDMKALADYVHGFGLKIGIYSSPGATTCGGCIGSLGYEAIDAETWANWGIDYLKHDWCGYGKVFSEETKGRKPTVDDYAKPYRLMSKCLRRQNRDIVHAFCQYGMGDVQSWGEAAGAQVWRSWGDLKDSWACVLKATESYAEAYKFTRPGFWCDPDMMVIGYLNTDFGMHDSFLSPNEQYTHVSLWCLLNAPLLLGCDLTRLSPFTKSLLVNDEVLAINQDTLGRQAGRVSHSDEADIWWRPLANGDSAAGLVNRMPFARTVTFRFADAGLYGSQAVRDLWRQQDMGVYDGTLSVTVPAHATFMVRLRPICVGCESRK